MATTRENAAAAQAGPPKPASQNQYAFSARSSPQSFTSPPTASASQPATDRPLRLTRR